MISRMPADSGAQEPSTTGGEPWAVAVADQSDYSAEVVAELQSFTGVSGRAGHRGFVTDVLSSALGGLLTAGVWDSLPFFAAYLLRHGPGSAPASASAVATNVIDTLATAGVVSAGDKAAVTDLVQGVGEGWTGTIRVGEVTVRFIASSDGTIVGYRTID
jgi:hypothetical protein